MVSTLHQNHFWYFLWCKRLYSLLGKNHKTHLYGHNLQFHHELSGTEGCGLLFYFITLWEDYVRFPSYFKKREELPRQCSVSRVPVTFYTCMYSLYTPCEMCTLDGYFLGERVGLVKLPAQVDVILLDVSVTVGRLGQEELQDHMGLVRSACGSRQDHSKCPQGPRGSAGSHSVQFILFV